MAENVFPREDHMAYLAERARNVIGERPDLKYIRIVADQPVHSRNYFVIVQDRNSGEEKRLVIDYRVIEECIYQRSDALLLQRLRERRDEAFPQ